MDWIQILIGVAAGFLGGGALAYVIWNKALNSKKQRIIEEAKSEGEVIKKDKILQAKEKFIQLKTDHEKFIQEKGAKIGQLENKLNQRENTINQRREELNLPVRKWKPFAKT
jgi:ribonuclease Y